MGFHHVGQASLELLTSGDLPALASQSARITSVSHCTQRVFLFVFRWRLLVAHACNPREFKTSLAIMVKPHL